MSTTFRIHIGNDKEGVRITGSIMYIAKANVRAFLTNYANRIPIISEYNNNPDVYVKVMVDFDLSAYNNELKMYNMLESEGITPKIVYHNLVVECKCYKLYKNEEGVEVAYHENETCYATVLVTTNCGETVAEKYLDESFRGPGSNSTDVTTDSLLFEELFPSDRVPDHIGSQILEILNLIYCTYNVSHDDIHAGNFLVDSEEKVRIIDFSWITENLSR